MRMVNVNDKISMLSQKDKLSATIDYEAEDVKSITEVCD